MKKLRIKNFGPIKEGFTDSEDGFFDISKLTLLVGDQGTGKSTIAKIISLFSWLEKQNQGQSNKVTVISSNDLCEKYLKFHRIDSFLQKDTEIIYTTDNSSLYYADGELHIQNVNEDYVRPKVLYIPAERSFCSAITNPNKISGMPSNVMDFLSDYYDSVKAQQGKKILLPLNGYEFRFSENENSAYISDNSAGYEIKIENASSGLQSVAPMYITINHYLDQLLLPVEKRGNELNIFQIAKLKLLANNNTHSLNELIQEQKKIINSRLVCIIEEPEQSLFPTSQYELIMNLLMGFSNKTDNSLVITTHSPYILETINNIIYADSITSNGKSIEHLIPSDCHISFDNVSAYQIENGKIHSIMDNEIKQIDSGAIDRCSKTINEVYSKLTDIDFGE